MELICPVTNHSIPMFHTVSTKLPVSIDKPVGLRYIVSEINVRVPETSTEYLLFFEYPITERCTKLIVSHNVSQSG